MWLPLQHSSLLDFMELKTNHWAGNLGVQHIECMVSDKFLAVYDISFVIWFYRMWWQPVYTEFCQNISWQVVFPETFRSEKISMYSLGKWLLFLDVCILLCSPINVRGCILHRFFYGRVMLKSHFQLLEVLQIIGRWQCSSMMPVFIHVTTSRFMCDVVKVIPFS